MSQILLKWGTLKGWDVTDDPAAQALLKAYFEEGASLSAMDQKDTPSQKETLKRLCRQVTGEIVNDWSGEVYTPEQACAYIDDYGKEG